MKKINLYNVLAICLLSAALFSAANAQEGISRGDAPKEFNNSAGRPNLLRELGLSREQMQQIRQINAGRRPQMMAAQQRQREATRNLDQAIYADSLNETQIAARLKELQTAQTEIAGLRSLNELEVRKILTPQQLTKFREVRERFAEMRENRSNRRDNQLNNPNRSAPNRRFNRELRKIPKD